MMSRILLSKDAAPSADDYVVWKGLPLNTGGKFPAANPAKNYLGCASLAAYNTSHPLPMSLTPGTYNLIFETNFDKAYAEPFGNNVLVKSVTVQ